jgi:hypothetical protein
MSRFLLSTFYLEERFQRLAVDSSLRPACQRLAISLYTASVAPLVFSKKTSKEPIASK